MLNLLRIIFGFIGGILAIYMLVTGNYLVSLLSLMSLFMGLMFFVMGVSDVKKSHKFSGYSMFLASGFIIFVAVYTFITTGI